MVDVAAAHTRSKGGTTIAIACGAAAAMWIVSPFFLAGPGEFFRNHEGHSYVYRLIEFVDCLHAGHVLPQWAAHFRSGLGSPYFGYYQPGLFYAAALFTPVLSPARALGAALGCFCVVGYLGMFRLVWRQFGVPAGVLAGSAFLFSAHTGTELYVRGDLSEFAALMSVPLLLDWLIVWIEEGRPIHWRALALGAGALPLLHGIGGMLGYALLGFASVWYGWAVSWRRGVWGTAALLLGAGIACAYWLPVALEWDAVQSWRAAVAPYVYYRNWIHPLDLVDLGPGRAWIAVTLGPIVPLVVLLNGIQLVARRDATTRPQCRLVCFLAAAAVVSVFMMTSASERIWQTVPLLPPIQFPWRIMLVLTVCLAGLTGAFVAPRGAVSAWAFVAVIFAALVVVQARYRPTETRRYAELATAAEIADTFFVPDGADEWLPEGAIRLRGRQVPREPSCTPSCRILSFDRRQGRLESHVRTVTDTVLVLPHYHFPLGWRATVDGRPVPLEGTARGLMAVRLPPGDQVVVVTFSMTPARRAGLAISAAALALWCALLFRDRSHGAG